MERTSVARGGLDEHIALLEAAGTLSILNHAAADAIFDRAARIEKLALGHWRAR